MAPLALVQNWSPDGATSVTYIAILPWIALLALSVSVELVSSSARVTSVKSQQALSLTSRHIDRTPGIPGSDKKSFRRLKLDARVNRADTILYRLIIPNKRSIYCERLLQVCFL